MRELRFGTHDPFTYAECDECGALELLDPPANPRRYYPDDYYAFAPKPRPGLTGALRVARNRLVLGRSGVLSQWLARVKPHAATPWFARMGITRRARILDVGCGAGDLLRDLAGAGFESLLGVDLWIPRAISDPAGFRVVKGSLADIHGEFDLVMFHHSFEHIARQRETLAAATKLLAPAGWCLIRVPIVPNATWEEYHEHWVQLDPPRHVMLHSVKSLTRLGIEAGLSLIAVDYDSTAFQFAGSELNRRGLRLDALDRVFPRREIQAFAARARARNLAGRGDQACFFFRRERQS